MSRQFPILSLAEARAFESRVLGEDAGNVGEAMEAAGQAIGRALLDDFKEAGSWPASPDLLILAGKGLNTGDAFVAAELLHEQVPHLCIRIVMTQPEEALAPLARRAFGRLREKAGADLESIPVEAFLERGSRRATVVLDGLYGMGFKPPLREVPRRLLAHVNTHMEARLRAAIDLPSGIGDGVDEEAFVADFTYVPGVAKAPLFLPDAVRKAGRIRFLPIEPFASAKEVPETDLHLADPSSFKVLDGLREPMSDKRDHGRCLILAGSFNMPGAALMAASAAVQSGAGLVTCFVPGNLSNHLASALPEAMWRSLPVRNDGSLDVNSVSLVSEVARTADALLIGPGMLMNKGTTFVVSRIIRECRLPVVLDASALIPDVLAAVLGRPLDALPVLITPHRGEYQRLLGRDGNTEDLEKLKAFSKRSRVMTLLKGVPNILCHEGECTYIPAGGPVLARGGSGDILAGILLRCLALLPTAPERAVFKAVTWHGAAADALARERGPTAVRTTELLSYLGPVLRG
jgi:NAD(P)H-hydrate epimerase